MPLSIRPVFLHFSEIVTDVKYSLPICGVKGSKLIGCFREQSVFLLNFMRPYVNAAVYWSFLAVGYREQYIAPAGLRPDH